MNQHEAERRLRLMLEALERYRAELANAEQRRNFDNAERAKAAIELQIKMIRKHCADHGLTLPSGATAIDK